MSIAVRGTATKFEPTAAVTTVTNSVPVGVVNNDYLLWVVHGTSLTPPTTPSGWALEKSVTQTGNGMFLYTRRAASEPGSYNMTVTSARWAGVMVAFSGVSTATAIDVATPTGTSGTTSITCPAITPVTANAAIVAIGGGRGPSADTTHSVSSSNTTIITSAVTKATGTTNNSLGVGWTTWTSGAFTPLMTDSATITVSQGLTVALRPAVTVTTVNIGQPSETDTPQTNAKVVRSRTVGQPTTTDFGLTPAARRSRAVGQATGTDTAQTNRAVHSRTLTQPSETDLAQTKAKTTKQRTVGQNTETDLSQPATRLKPPKFINIGQASEIDDQPVITRVESHLLGQATETETVTSRGANWSPNPTIETTVAPWTTDTAGFRAAALSVIQSNDRAHGGTFSIKATWPTTTSRGSGVTSGDWAINLGTSRGGDIFGFEIGRAYTLSAWIYVPSGSPDMRASFRLKIGGNYISTKDAWFQASVTWVADTDHCGLAFETTEGAPLTGGTAYIDDISLTSTGIVKSKTPSQPSETDLAQSDKRVHARRINQNLETDLGQPVTAHAPTRVDIGMATEDDLAESHDTTTEDAQGVRVVKSKAIGQATSTSLAQPLTRGALTNTGAANLPVTATLVAAAGTSFSDDFNRVNGALGTFWVSSATPMLIVSNAVSTGVSGTAATVSRWYQATPTTSHWSQFTFRGGLGTGVAVAIPTGYAEGDALNTMGPFYVFNRSTAGGSTVLVRKDPSSPTFLNLLTGGPDVTSGDVMRLEYDGTELIAKINGAIVLRYTPTTPITGQPGIGIAYRGIQNSTSLLDDWSGGSLTTGQSALVVTVGRTAVGTSTKPIDASVGLVTNLTAAGTRLVFGDSLLPVAAALSAAAATTKPLNAALGLVTNLTAAGTSNKNIDAVAQVVANLTAAATVTRTLTASLPVTVGLTATSTPVQFGAASLPVTTSLTAAGQVTRTGAAALPVTAGLTATIAAVRLLAATGTFTAGLTAVAAAARALTASQPVTVGLTGSGVSTKPLNSTLPLTANLTAAAVVTAGISLNVDFPIAVGFTTNTEANRLVDLYFPLTVTLTGDGIGLKNDTTLPLTVNVGLTASGGIARPYDSNLPLTAPLLSDGASTKPIDATRPIVAALTSTLDRQANVPVSLPVTVGLTAAASVVRSLTASLVVTLNSITVISARRDANANLNVGIILIGSGQVILPTFPVPPWREYVLPPPVTNVTLAPPTQTVFLPPPQERVRSVT